MGEVRPKQKQDHAHESRSRRYALQQLAGRRTTKQLAIAVK